MVVKQKRRGGEYGDSRVSVNCDGSWASAGIKRLSTGLGMAIKRDRNSGRILYVADGVLRGSSVVLRVCCCIELHCAADAAKPSAIDRISKTF